MNPIRLLILIAAVWLVLYAVRRLRSRRRDAGHARPPTTRMVRCERCGLHVPEEDATRDDGRFYCCPEHRRTPR